MIFEVSPTTSCLTIGFGFVYLYVQRGGVEMRPDEKLELLLEKYLCYRALLLAIKGKYEQAEALRWYLRRKREQPHILESRISK